MKRVISAVLMLVMVMSMFVGCKASNEVIQATKGPEVLSQLNAMKEQNKKPREIFDYLNQSIKELNKEEAAEAVGVLITVLEEYEDIYNEQLFEENIPDLMFQYFEHKFDYSRIESIKEQELKDLLYDICLGGFRIMDIEGTFMVIVDYEALKTFKEYIDDETNAYIEIMAMRYNDPAAVDASLEIDPKQLENRITKMESYIKSYDNQQRKEMIKEIYLGDIMMYMSGTDNSPVFDYDTGVMNPDMLEVFERASAEYKDTVFGKLMNSYVELLKAEGFINTEKVQDFILNVNAFVDEQL